MGSARRRPPAGALGVDQVRAIVRDQIDEATREADRYDGLGQARAQRLRRQARVLAAYAEPAR